MGKDYLRTFRLFDIEEIQKHLLIVGDLVADCANCREIGLDPYQTHTCPKCGTPFKYVSSRRTETHPGERFQIVRRVLERKPDLIFIDYTDYSKLTGQKKARDFFG